MKGLLLKDWYTLLKQVKLFLVIIVIFAIIPGFSVAYMAVFYAAMLPITALAYDERAKWDQLAAMMPYSTRAIVLSKYLIGFGAIIVASLLSMGAGVVIAAIRRIAFEPESLLAILFVACASAIMLAINLPIMFRFGVEKGRIAFFVLIGAVVAGSVALGDRLGAPVSALSTDAGTIALLSVAIAVAATAASVATSIRMYKRRMG